MKVLRCFFTVVVCCGAFSGMYAGSRTDSYHKKIYVSKEAVKISDEGILVNTRKGVVVAKALYCDQNGLFFLKSALISKSKKKYGCPKCHRNIVGTMELNAHLYRCPFTST